MRVASSEDRPASRAIRPKLSAQTNTPTPRGRARTKPRWKPCAVNVTFSADSARPGNDLLLLLAQALDAEGHHVARLEEHRVRLDAEADARRRAGADHVARQQRHVVTDV